MRTDVGVVLTDTHITASTGLLPPDATADDGAAIPLNKIQKWLGGKLTLTLQQATQELEPQDDGKRWLFHLGDILEGLHHDSTQVSTFNMATMRRCGVQTLKPWLAWCDYAFFQRGTGAHSGNAGADEESIADALSTLYPGKVQRDPVTGTYTTAHRTVRVQQVTCDLAHHPPSGTGREYLAHGPAGVLATSVLLDYTLTGDAPPTVVFRGHLHPRKGIYDTGWTYPVRAVICPSWKLIDELGSKRTPGAVNVVGAVFFRVTGARIDLWPVTYFPKRQKAWTETT